MIAAKTDLLPLSEPSATRFIGDWLAGALALPICPCQGRDLYTAYLRWCRTNGESRPSPENQFHGAVTNIPGWSKRTAIIYASLARSLLTAKTIVFPPPDVLAASGHARSKGQTEISWITESVVAFSDAFHSSMAD